MKMSPIAAALALTAISLGYASAQSGSPNNISGSNVAQRGGAPPCVGRNPHVAVPTAPHGMYVWLYSLDAGRTVDLFQKYVIGKDPSLCGVSAVVSWSDVEKAKGSFDFSKVEQNLKPFMDAGLTVNLLFAAAGEGKDNTTTPHWVMAEVPKTFCGGVHLPIYWNPKFEAEWSAFIRQAITYFSHQSPIKNQIGYLRFATGAGAEALPPPGATGGPCAKLLRQPRLLLPSLESAHAADPGCDGQRSDDSSNRRRASPGSGRTDALRSAERFRGRCRSETRRVVV